MNGRAGRADKRGNNIARARRRVWLLRTFDADLGPERARCALKLSAMCERVVDAITLSVDRIELGGSYRRENIQPACKPCQDKQGGLVTLGSMSELVNAYRDARDRWEVRFDVEVGVSYRPGIIREYERKSRRGGRNEVTDWVAENPPPVFRDWLVEWHASRREPCEDAAGALSSASAV